MPPVAVAVALPLFWLKQGMFVLFKIGQEGLAWKRIEDVFLLVSTGIACGHAQVGWCAATLAVATAYFRAFGASLGLGQNFCGPCAKPHRMAILTGGLLASMLQLNIPFLLIALWIIVLLTAVTMARRVYHIYTKLP